MSLSALTYGIAWAIFAYVIIYHLGYFLLHILAVVRMHDAEQSKILTDLPYLHSELEPPISVLLPIHEYTANILQATQALLHLDYSKFEVIVINDSAQDSSLQALITAYDLHPFPEAYRVQLKTQAVKCIYRSSRYPHLRVIDKEYGGTADALNAGINASRYPLFCSMGVDTQVRRDSLQYLATPFLNDHRVIASVAAARAASPETGLPKRWSALLKMVDQLRIQLYASLGWSMLNSMLIAPAGMMLLRKEAVIAAGAFSRGAHIAGMELITRMHRVMRQKQQAYRIRFIADPICWQQMPDSFSALKTDCMRSQQGVADSLSQNMGLLFGRNSGSAGRLAFPFLLLFELVGPLMECLAYIFLLAGLASGVISWPACFAFLSVMIALGILLSASGLLLEERAFHLYPKTSDICTLILVAIVSNVGYRQLNSVWRSIALITWYANRKPGELPEYIAPKRIN
ncbi:glycosyl transferase [Herminiimonas sp. KBW02]|uniref:glycosyltransferase family 2 protein n=1 Tax=Herminiimonas sp. KBW02 TaxID=2153363 RepID=UPI000F5B1F3F|nr:glycosyltransferase family 2 protein [Herminiimonas sp. KBW02]RQO33911.1 glycosyl transferase [Herminiimonas sp. KBW02]